MDAKSGQLKIESMSSGVAPKGTLLVALELHLFMQLSMHKSVQNDSTF